MGRSIRAHFHPKEDNLWQRDHSPGSDQEPCRARGSVAHPVDQQEASPNSLASPSCLLNRCLRKSGTVCNFHCSRSTAQRGLERSTYSTRSPPEAGATFG